MGNNVNSVSVIDTSGSMTDYGYVHITKRASSAFVSYFRPGDGLGVVNFDIDGHYTYPTSRGLAIVDANLTQNGQAADKIEALSFDGLSTNIGDGILKARASLDSAATPKAIVLLSDGENTKGPSPSSVLPHYPIYACAMGPHADFNLMEKIATQTAGKYYCAPYPSTMMSIYNQIRGQPDYVKTVQNKINQIQPSGYALVPATFGSSESAGQFGITWDDASLKYTDSSNPGAGQISVTLVQSDCTIYGSAPDIVGDGYAVFNVANPVGTWHTQVILGSGSPPIQATTSAFEFPSDAAASPSLALALEPPAALGEPLVVTSRVTEGGQPIENLKIEAAVTKPVVSVANALQKHRAALAEIEPDEDDLAAGLPEDRARLSKLYRQLLPKVDILPYQSTPVFLRQYKDGSYRAEVGDTHQAGSYSVTVTVHGTSPSTGTEFQRTEYVATVVE